MDFRYKLFISVIISAFVLDWVVAPALTAASTAQNLIGLCCLGALGWLVYLFYTRIESKNENSNPR